jgi:hypothetical protein
MISEIFVFPHTTGFFQWPLRRSHVRSAQDPSDKIPYRASEPSPSTVGAPLFQPEWISFAQKNNNSRSDKSAEQRDRRSIRRQTTNHTRPETHQNLIHISKEQTRPPNDNRRATAQTA